MTTAAVIVTYNSADCIGGCLAAAAPCVDRVVVVDNASGDDSVAKARAFPGATVIANARNRGFAAAANQGVVASAAEMILLLNPDVILQTPVDDLVQACRRPGIAAAAGKLADGAGKAQEGFTVRRFPGPAALSFESLGVNRLWPGNPVNRRYRCADLNLEQTQRVEQPAGALLLFRRDLWERLGGFDQRFHPLWFEDVDFMKRTHEAGYAAIYTPSVWGTHSGGHSIPSIGERERRYFWYGNLLLYAAKHFGFWGLRATAASVALGGAVRMLLAAGGGYGAVVRLAGAVLFCGPECLDGGARRARQLN
ncbi:MAG: glycosyltransferase family 2 protein [Bryobacteraceae bacterium]